jgi:hypothetical protein
MVLVNGSLGVVSRHQRRLLHIGALSIAGLFLLVGQAAGQSITGELFAGIGSFICCDGNASA